MAKVIMVQGTMSNAGKSLIAGGLCRIFHQDGYKVAPFKSQNMALNSFITEDGLEMGRAQVMQAEAAGIKPDVRMNPILLKPTNDVGSQVIVNGEILGTMSARDYFAYKKNLVPDIMKAFNSLASENDIIVIEGAGSPAEINLKDEDIVNMGMAKMAGAPVLLVGDIDRGGVFAQLIGTVDLLEDDERSMVKGLIINKFRGDKTILDPGVSVLEERSGIPVVGVAPYINVDIEDEDSLSERLVTSSQVDLVDIAVVRLPRISNFTDFNALEAIPGVSVRYCKSADQIKNPDMVIIPGSKNTISDMLWMRQNGMEAAILKLVAEGKAIFGVCGGYQILGETLSDPLGVETLGEVRGMGLLPIDTVFKDNKTRTRVTGCFHCGDSIFGGLCADSDGSNAAGSSAAGSNAPDSCAAGSCAAGAMPYDGVRTSGSSRDGARAEGYEIHMGETTLRDGAKALMTITDSVSGTSKADGCYAGNVFGSYVHGVFDGAGIAMEIVRALGQAKGVDITSADMMDYESYKETQYDLLADSLRGYLDMNKIYEILEAGI